MVVNCILGHVHVTHWLKSSNTGVSDHVLVECYKIDTRIFFLEGWKRSDFLYRMYTRVVMVGFGLVMLELFCFETEDGGTHIK